MQNSGHKPSEYQKAIYDWVLHGTGNAVISAAAGCGKTTVIVEAMSLIPKDKKVLFIAFNKSIVNELKSRVDSMDNCRVCTIHSLGFSLVRKHFDTEPTIEDAKYKRYLKENIYSLTSSIDEDTEKSVVANYIDSVLSLTDLSRANLCQSPKEICRIASKYGIAVQSDECFVVAKMLEWGKSVADSVIDYGDMVWLPYELSMNPIGNRFDWVMIDECQDFSKAYTNLFLRCFRRGTRFIAVGDRKQCINVFAGADEHSFNALCSYPNTRVFSLPISYRCDRVIIDMAKAYNPDIMCREWAGEGSFIKNVRLSDVVDGDMVLCRNNAPLFKAYIKLLNNNVQCYLNGGCNVERLLSLLSYPDEMALSADFLSDGLFPSLFRRVLDMRDSLCRARRLDAEDAMMEGQVQSLYDDIKCLEAVSCKFDNVGMLKDMVRRIFDTENKGVCLSTIHKAKGLEADNVYILCRSAMPSPMAIKKWEREQEDNLIYVAYTRPKHVLGFVSEADVSPYGGTKGKKGMAEELKEVEGRLERLYGRIPLSNAEDKEDGCFSEESCSTNIADTHNSLDDLLTELG